jgi:hypothetical protein
VAYDISATVKRISAAEINSDQTIFGLRSCHALPGVIYRSKLAGRKRTPGEFFFGSLAGDLVALAIASARFIPEILSIGNAIDVRF